MTEKRPMPFALETFLLASIAVHKERLNFWLALGYTEEQWRRHGDGLKARLQQARKRAVSGEEKAR